MDFRYFSTKQIIDFIKDYDHYFYHVAKKFFCFKNVIDKRRERIYGKDTIEEIMATSNFNKIVDLGNITNLYPNSSDGREGELYNSKYKVYQKELLKFKKTWAVSDMTPIEDAFSFYFKRYNCSSKMYKRHV